MMLDVRDNEIIENALQLINLRKLNSTTLDCQKKFRIDRLNERRYNKDAASNIERCNEIKVQI